MRRTWTRCDQALILKNMVPHIPLLSQYERDYSIGLVIDIPCTTPIIHPYIPIEQVKSLYRVGQVQIEPKLWLFLYTILLHIQQHDVLVLASFFLRGSKYL